MWKLIYRMSSNLYILLAFFMLSCMGCSSDVVSNKNDKNDIISDATLIKTKTKSFELDSETPPSSNHYQILNTDTLIYFTLLNSYNNSIYFYDFNTSDFLFKRTYVKVGPNGVGKIFGYYVHSLDSIFIHNYDASKLFLMNEDCAKLRTYDLDSEHNYNPSAKVFKNSPGKIFNDILYMTGNITGEYADETAENRPVLIKLDLTKGELSYNIGYPEEFRKGNYGGGQYRWINSNFKVQDSLILISFATGHNLRVYNVSKDTSYMHQMSSSYIDGIPSIPARIFSVSKQEIRDHFIVNGSYQSVGFVPYGEFYFRKVYLPKKDYDPSNFNGLQSSYILTDKNFKKIGEKLFPLRSYSDFCISPIGLMLRKMDVGEDVLMFDIFELKYNE